jgi:FMN phosphatase YigB (HAD superfamily)
VLALTPADTVFFDDHVPNVQTATGRGWQGVHVPEPGHLIVALPLQLQARGIDLTGMASP